MRSLSILFALSFLSFPVIAESEVEKQINQACLRHSASMIARLKADVIGELNQAQTDQALKIAKESCQAYFLREFDQQPIVASGESKPEKDDEKDDWFSSTEKKEGNKRIERKQRGH